MFGVMCSPPINENTTYIFHTDKFTEKNVLEWLPEIRHRLVIVTDKYPKITKKSEGSVIIDESLEKRKKENYVRACSAMLSWSDRDRVLSEIENAPIPLALAFARANIPHQMDFWREIAGTLILDDEYTKALIAFGITPDVRHVKYPTKKRVQEEIPYPFTSRDKYWETIIKNNKAVANEVRDTNEVLPSKMKKKKERVNEWI
tara:strand:- start:19151 stop:19759 length:609 start_codon:yes stop_codon:yes gene_type:complete